MLTIARFTLLEASRSRLFIAVIAAVVALFGLAEFIGEISITETRQVQASVTASLLRLACVFIACLSVISSGLRERNDKGLELILSLPQPRSVYLFGKLLGFAGLSFCVSVIAALPLFLYAPVAAVCYWAFSLCCELLLLTAFSLLCLLTFANTTLAATLVMAFYLLSRSVDTLCLLSAGPTLSSAGAAQDVIYLLTRALAVLLPDLDAFTRGAWLVYGVDANTAGTVLAQTLLYLLVLLSAGLFDLYRKNL